MKNPRNLLHFLLFTTFIIFNNKTYALDYYWVGGTGNWSDYSNHWATSSGGNTFHTQVPQSTDDVFFDGNSFSAMGQAVNIDVPTAYCNNMNWVNVSNNPILDGASANVLKIYGSLDFSPIMILNFAGFASFEASTIGKTINLAGKSFNNNVSFNSVAGGWDLQSALSTTKNIYLNAGKLNSNNHNVNCFSFISGGTSARTLTMGSSNFNLFGVLWQISGSGITLNSGTSTINVNCASTFKFYGFALNYYNLNFINTSAASHGVVYDNNTFNNVSFASHGQITSNNTFNNLTLAPGYTYTLDVGKTQTIIGSLLATGNCTSLIAIQTNSLGGQSTIIKTSGVLSLSYLVLKDINVSGGATFTANNSADLGNNTGWTINPFVSVNLYWIGNGGNWSDGNHWSFTSGGAPSGCSPTPLDNVFFDANSFTMGGQSVNIDAPTAYCNDMTWTGATNNPTFDGININNLRICGSLTFTPLMTLSFAGPVSFEAVIIGKTITSAGKSFNNNVNFHGIGGAWTLQDAFKTTKNIYLDAGTLNSNNQTVSCLSFFSTLANNRTLNMGASIFNLSGSLWQITGSGITLNSGTSTININYGALCKFYGNALSYYNLNFISTSAASTGTIYDNNTFHDVAFASHGEITSNNTFNNLTFSPGRTYTLGSTKTQTIIGSFSATGTCTSLIDIRNNVDITGQSNILKTTGTVTLSYVILKDINASGGATFNANNPIDLGNNSGWTMNAPSVTRDLYWIGNGGNWSNGNHWSLTSGGMPFGCYPTPLDNVFFDANSFTLAGQNVNIDVATAYCNDMTWTNVTNNPTFSGAATNNLRIYGSLAFSPAMTLSFAGPVSFEAIAMGKTITSAGKSFTNTVGFNSVGGGWTLLDALTTTKDIYLNAGNLNTNDQTINCLSFFSVSTKIRTLTMGASAFNLLGEFWKINGLGITLNAGTSNINLSYLGVGKFYGYGLVYYNLNFTNISAAAVGTIYDDNNIFNDVIFSSHGEITSSNTFNNLTFSPGYTYTLMNGKTQTITPLGTIHAIGTASLPIRIQSKVLGSATTFFKSSGRVCLDYVRLSDNTATGGAIFNAGLAPDRSQDMGGNVGWIFEGAPTINTHPSDSTICEGTNATFSVIANGTGLDYQWQVDQGMGFTDLTNVAPYSGVTTDTLIITAATIAMNGYQYRCIAIGCDPDAISNAAKLTVNPLPNVNAGNDQTVCSGNQVTLVGTGANNYSWDHGVTQGIAFVITTTTTYTVTGIDLNGCINTDQVIVTVNPLPNVNAGNDQIICFNEEVTLIATGANNYVWDNNVTQNIAFTPITTNTYTVIGTDANGCTNTDQVTVIVNPLPNVNAGNDQIICFNEEVTLIATGANNYVWDNNVTQNIAFTPITTNTYTVIGTDANGCTNTDQVTVTINPLPVVNAGNDQTICLGNQITLIGTGANNYVWDNGVTQNNPFNPMVTTIYNVTGTDVNGCTNTDEVIITVDDLPLINLSIDTIICEGEILILNVGNPNATYVWQDNSTDSTFKVTQAGVYSVEVTNHCGKSSDNIRVSLEDCSCTLYFPNTFTPNGDEINNTFSPVFECDLSEYSFHIYNRWGEIVFESYNPNFGWDGTYKQISSPMGIYTYSVIYKSEKEAVKIKQGHVNLVR